MKKERGKERGKERRGEESNAHCRIYVYTTSAFWLCWGKVGIVLTKRSTPLATRLHPTLLCSTLRYSTPLHSTPLATRLRLDSTPSSSSCDSTLTLLHSTPLDRTRLGSTHNQTLLDSVCDSTQLRLRLYSTLLATLLDSDCDSTQLRL